MPWQLCLMCRKGSKSCIEYRRGQLVLARNGMQVIIGSTAAPRGDVVEQVVEAASGHDVAGGPVAARRTIAGE